MQIFLGAHFWHDSRYVACKNNDADVRFHMEKFNAKHYHIHEKYLEMPSESPYDIALILLDAKACRLPICLPPKGRYYLKNGSP